LGNKDLLDTKQTIKSLEFNSIKSLGISHQQSHFFSFSPQLGTRIAELETLLAASNDKLAMEKRKNDQRIETAMRALQGQLPIGMHEPMNVRDQQTNNNGQGAQGIQQQQQQQQCSSQSASATGNGGGGKQMEQSTSRSSSHSLVGLPF